MGKKELIETIIADARFQDIAIDQPPPVITIKGKTIATPGNFITINGLPKSRKTTFVFFAIAAALRSRPVFDIQVNLEPDEKIILVDTEQSIFDFAKQIKGLKHLLGSQSLPDQFSAYLFRKHGPDVILNSIYTLVKTERPKVLFIDNLTELVINPNDMAESKNVIQFLKKITAEFNIVVVCLLHLAKSNLQSLGNLGSYADRGAQSVLKVTIDKETQSSTLEPTMMRSDLYFDPITIAWDPEVNQYVAADQPAEKTNRRKFVLMDLNDQDHFNRLGAIFRDNKSLVYGELIEELKKLYGVGTNIAKQQILPYLAGNNFLASDRGIYTPIYKK